MRVRYAGRLFSSIGVFGREQSAGVVASGTTMLCVPFMTGGQGGLQRLGGSWGLGVGAGRWLGSHISRHDDNKRSGKGKKKKGGVAGQKKHRGGTGVGARKIAARDETVGEDIETVGEDIETVGENIETVGEDIETVGPSVSPIEGEPSFSYSGPFSNAVTKVKRLSLFSCFVTISSVPIMLGLDPAVLVEGAAATSMTARMSLAASLSAFGLGTTGLLHYFVYPYVHALTIGDDGKLRVETLDFFARKRVTNISVEDVDGGASDSMHPLSTFRDRRDGRLYYVDRDFFRDKELLELLDPTVEVEDTD